MVQLLIIIEKNPLSSSVDKRTFTVDNITLLDNTLPTPLSGYDKPHYNPR